jgi:hypothetical protein
MKSKTYGKSGGGQRRGNPEFSWGWGIYHCRVSLNYKKCLTVQSSLWGRVVTSTTWQNSAEICRQGFIIMLSLSSGIITCYCVSLCKSPPIQTLGFHTLESKRLVSHWMWHYKGST